MVREVRDVPASQETVHLAWFEVLAALVLNVAIFCVVRLRQSVISVTDVSIQRSVLIIIIIIIII